MYICIYTHGLIHMHTNVFCQVLHEKGLCKLYIVKVKSESEKETDKRPHTHLITHTQTYVHMYTRM